MSSKFRVTVYRPEPFCWEGEAINSTDAMIQARAAAHPERWREYMNRPADSHLAPLWSLFKHEQAEPFGLPAPIQCKVENIG
jgi:hypothetical protein